MLSVKMLPLPDAVSLHTAPGIKIVKESTKKKPQILKDIVLFDSMPKLKHPPTMVLDVSTQL